MTAIRTAAQQALEALEWFNKYGSEQNGPSLRGAECALRAALAERQSTHSAACYQWHHKCAIAEVERLRAALAKPQSGWDKWQAQKRGCSVCGVGANGETVGYVCIRNDCPTRLTCGGTP